MARKSSLSDLSRVAAMYEGGWLTDDEYQSEKDRILHGASQRQQSRRPDSDVQTKLLVALPLAAIVAGFAAWFIHSNSSGSQDNEVSSSAPPKRAIPSLAVPKASKPVPAVSLDAAITFSEPSNCVAGPGAEKAFASMLPISEASGEILASRPVKLGSLTITPSVRDVVASDDPPGTVSKEASVRFPANATWHGLRLSRMIVSRYIPPDADSNYTRSITFLETPSKVSEALATLRFNPPAAGDFRQLSDDVCGGSMEILPIAGGTQLKCSWGC